MTDRQLIVDWSNHKKTVDVAALAAVRATMFIHKATEGTHYVDPYYVDNVNRAQDAGYLTGAYHWLTKNEREPVRDQVDLFLETTAKTPGPKALLVDVEALDGFPDVQISDVDLFYVDMRTSGVVQPIPTYTGGWYWGRPGQPGHMGNPDGSHNGELWDSSYVAAQHADPWTLLGDLQPGDMNGAGVTPDYFPAYGGWTLETRVMRQYSSSALIQGMDIDVSVFYGTRDELAARLIGAGPVAPSPAPGPAPARVPLAVDGGFGPLTIMRLQEVTGAAVDGVFGPETIKALQRWLGVPADGVVGPITIRALQTRVGATPDGSWGPATTKALQAYLNQLS